MNGEAVLLEASRGETSTHAERARLGAALMAGDELVRIVHPALSGAGYWVQSLTDSPLEQLRERQPAVILLEFGMKDSDTLGLCRALRSHPEFSNTAIIFIAAKAEETDRVLGLEAGADVYLAMPFAGRELIAQVKAVLRSYARRLEREHLSAGEIEIDVPGMTVKVAGQAVALSITEFRLLEFLCRNLGRAISRDQLVQIVSKNARMGRRAVDVYIRRLRQKIERQPGEPNYLKTVRGVGYRLDGGRKLK